VPRSEDLLDIERDLVAIQDVCQQEGGRVQNEQDVASDPKRPVESQQLVQSDAALNPLDPGAEHVLEKEQDEPQQREQSACGPHKGTQRQSRRLGACPHDAGQGKAESHDHQKQPLFHVAS
jgi:hypothetical protein